MYMEHLCINSCVDFYEDAKPFVYMIEKFPSWQEFKIKKLRRRFLC